MREQNADPPLPPNMAKIQIDVQWLKTYVIFSFYIEKNVEFFFLPMSFFREKGLFLIK